MKRILRKTGDILKIDLGNGFHNYACVSTDPCLIFYEGRFSSDLSIGEIANLQILYKLFVSNFAIKDGIWPIIGKISLTKEQLTVPYMYKKDRVSGALSIYHSDFAATNYEIPATLEDCKNLECAAVWDPNNIVDRLNDYYLGT